MTALLVKLFIKNSSDTLNPTVRQAYGTLGGVTGIICNLILCIIKILVGLFSASISILADGLNNLSDMGSSVITMIGFKLAGKPADSDHPYGHGRMEYMSAFIVAVLIILVGVELLKESVSAIISGTPAPVYGAASIMVLVCSVAAKLWMFFFNRNLGKRIGSDAFKATAQDCVNDSIASGVILLSVIISRIVTLPFNLDAYMGIAVAVFILYSGYNSAKETLDSILGTPPDEALINGIRDCIFSFDCFLGLHDLIVHNYGPGRQFASVHVEVPRDIDVVICHEYIDTCEKLAAERLGIELVIHMDPIETDNDEINTAKAVISEELARIHHGLTLHDFRMTPKGDNRTNFIFDVVKPSSVPYSDKELREIIDKTAKNINPGYYCVITFDNDYTGH